VIRALHVITRLTLGGSSENTIGQMVTLARAGYDSALAIGLAESDVATVDDARRRGCRIVSVPGLGREVTPTRDLIALLQLVRLFRRERPAIVHTHTSKAGFIGRLAARIARVPVVIHQPHGDTAGQALDVEIQAKELLRLRSLLDEILAHHTGQPVDRVRRDTDRDFIMSAEEAKDYGLVDEVLSSRELAAVATAAGVR